MSAHVRPLVLEPSDSGPPTTRALDVVELSRVPAQHEYIAIGGEHYAVISVTHHVVGGVAAEVHCERLPKLPPVEAPA